MANMDQHGENGTAWVLGNMEHHGDYGTVWRIWNSMAIAALVAVKLNFKAGGIKLFDHGYTILEKI